MLCIICPVVCTQLFPFVIIHVHVCLHRHELALVFGVKFQGLVSCWCALRTRKMLDYPNSRWVLYLSSQKIFSLLQQHEEGWCNKWFGISTKTWLSKNKNKNLDIKWELGEYCCWCWFVFNRGWKWYLSIPLTESFFLTSTFFCLSFFLCCPKEADGIPKFFPHVFSIILWIAQRYCRLSFNRSLHRARVFRWT